MSSSYHDPCSSNMQCPERIALENCDEWDFDEAEQNVGGHPDTKFIIYIGYMGKKQKDYVPVPYKTTTLTSCFCLTSIFLSHNLLSRGVGLKGVGRGVGGSHGRVGG